MPTDRDMWLKCSIVGDSFWTMANLLSLDAAAPFESTEEDENHAYQTLPEDPH